MTFIIRLLAVIGRFSISTARGGYQAGLRGAAWIDANLFVRR